MLENIKSPLEEMEERILISSNNKEEEDKDDEIQKGSD
jgi:hypothetical protein